MKKLFTFLFVFCSLTLSANEMQLVDEMRSLDSAAFDAFNNCEKLGELDKHASYFSLDVEFYHDTGGVTWNRDSMIANTKKNVCGNFTRKLVDGSFKVNIIKGFGAITEGVHVFCQTKTKE